MSRKPTAKQATKPIDRAALDTWVDKQINKTSTPAPTPKNALRQLPPKATPAPKVSQTDAERLRSTRQAARDIAQTGTEANKQRAANFRDQKAYKAIERENQTLRRLNPPRTHSTAPVPSSKALVPVSAPTSKALVPASKAAPTPTPKNALRQLPPKAAPTPTPKNALRQLPPKAAPTPTPKNALRQLPPKAAPTPTPTQKASLASKAVGGVGRMLGAGATLMLSPNNNIATDEQERSELQKFASKSTQPVPTKASSGVQQVNQTSITPTKAATQTKAATPVSSVSTKGGVYPVYAKGSEKSKSFNSAFGAARKAGKTSFEWEGRSYNTKRKG